MQRLNMTILQKVTTIHKRQKRHYGADRNLEESEAKERLRYAYMSNTSSTVEVADCHLALIHTSYQSDTSLYLLMHMRHCLLQKPIGKELLEPCGGNGGHCALGLGVYGESFALQIHDADLFVSFAAHVGYLFQASQTRTYGLYNHR